MYNTYIREIPDRNQKGKPKHDDFINAHIAKMYASRFHIAKIKSLKGRLAINMNEILHARFANRHGDVLYVIVCEMNRIECSGRLHIKSNLSFRMASYAK